MKTSYLGHLYSEREQYLGLRVLQKGLATSLHAEEPGDLVICAELSIIYVS